MKLRTAHFSQLQDHVKDEMNSLPPIKKVDFFLYMLHQTTAYNEDQNQKAKVHFQEETNWQLAKQIGKVKFHSRDL